MGEENSAYLRVTRHPILLGWLRPPRKCVKGEQILFYGSQLTRFSHDQAHKMAVVGSTTSKSLKVKEELVGVRGWNGSRAASLAASVDRLRRSRCELPAPAVLRQ